jgi:rod shape-determining protein MreC
MSRHRTPPNESYHWLHEVSWIILALLLIQWDQNRHEEDSFAPSHLLVPWILPLQHMSSNYANDVNSFWQNRFQFETLSQEYAILKKKMNGLQIELARIKDLAVENERLRNLLSFQVKRKDLKLCYAQVITQQRSNSDEHIYSLRLYVTMDSHNTKELINQIKVGSVVLAQGVMIGFIKKINLPYLLVLPIQSPTVNLDVVLDKSRLRGVATGLTDQTNDEYTMSLKYLEKSRLAILGERAVSTGLDGKYPSGLVIGEIAHRHIPANGVFQKAYLKSPIDYKYVRDVAIVLNETSTHPPDKQY